MTTLTNTDTGDILNTATSSSTNTSHGVFIGGLVGYVDKYCWMDVTNGINEGDESSTNADQLCLGSIVGFTSTAIKLQYARNNGEVKILGGTRDSSVKIGGIAGLLNSKDLNINNCRNYGNITVTSTITGGLYAGGIVGHWHIGQTTDKYNLYFIATIDTHAATVSGENYTAGLLGAPTNENVATFIFNGLRFNGTVIGNKTKTGLLCNSRNSSSTVKFKGTCYIAPGSSRQYTGHTNTVNTDSDLTMDVICGYLGSGSTVSGVSVTNF